MASDREQLIAAMNMMDATDLTELLGFAETLNELHSNSKPTGCLVDDYETAVGIAKYVGIYASDLLRLTVEDEHGRPRVPFQLINKLHNLYLKKEKLNEELWRTLYNTSYGDEHDS